MTIRRSAELEAPSPSTSDLRDLFNQSQADWAEHPRTTFDAWLAARHFRGSSADVYRAQFHHFLDWLNERGKTLVHAEPSLIDAFVATLDVKRQQRARYLRIMERVFDDMFNNAPAGGNPARPIARAIDAPWTDTRSNAPTGFLTPAQRATLWEAFELNATGQRLDHTANSTGKTVAPLHWRDQRDRALGAVLLGAGLKLSEAEHLQWDAVDLTRKRLTVVAEDPRYTRQIPLDAPLWDILAHWRRTHEEIALEGGLVFPAGRSGHAMHKATALRAIDTIVSAARLRDGAEHRISPQTLRNAYAATLFESDASDELLAERLGFAQLLSAKRLRAAWQEWQRARVHTSEVRQAVAQAQASSAGSIPPENALNSTSSLTK